MGALLDRVHRGVPAPLLFVAGGCSTYLGAALAVGLFELLSPAGWPGCGCWSPRWSCWSGGDRTARPGVAAG